MPTRTTSSPRRRARSGPPRHELGRPARRARRREAHRGRAVAVGGPAGDLRQRGAADGGSVRRLIHRRTRTRRSQPLVGGGIITQAVARPRRRRREGVPREHRRRGAVELPRPPTRHRHAPLLGDRASAHQSAYVTAFVDGLLDRDVGVAPRPGALPDNDLPSPRAMNAALWHLDRWVRGEATPPEQPLLAISGSPVDIERDPFGNTIRGCAPARARGADQAVRTRSACHRQPSPRAASRLPFDDALLRPATPRTTTTWRSSLLRPTSAVDAGVLLDRDAEVGCVRPARRRCPPQGREDHSSASIGLMGRSAVARSAM